MNNFSEKQLQAIELIAVSEVEGLTHLEIAEQIGVSTKTIQRWKKDTQLMREVQKRVLELMAMQSPKVLKNTLDLLDSKDLRMKVQGQQFFDKSMDRLEQLKAEDKEQESKIDVEYFLNEIGVGSLEKAHDKKRFLQKQSREDSERCVLALNSYVRNKELLEYMKDGDDWRTATSKNNRVLSDEEVVEGLRQIFKIDLYIKENTEQEETVEV